MPALKGADELLPLFRTSLCSPRIVSSETGGKSKMARAQPAMWGRQWAEPGLPIRPHRSRRRSFKHR